MGSSKKRVITGGVSYSYLAEAPEKRLVNRLAITADFIDSEKVSYADVYYDYITQNNKVAHRGVKTAAREFILPTIVGQETYTSAEEAQRLSDLNTWVNANRYPGADPHPVEAGDVYISAPGYSELDALERWISEQSALERVYQMPDVSPYPLWTDTPPLNEVENGIDNVYFVAGNNHYTTYRDMYILPHDGIPEAVVYNEITDKFDVTMENISGTNTRIISLDNYQPLPTDTHTIRILLDGKGIIVRTLDEATDPPEVIDDDIKFLMHTEYDDGGGGYYTIDKAEVQVTQLSLQNYVIHEPSGGSTSILTQPSVEPSAYFPALPIVIGQSKYTEKLSATDISKYKRVAKAFGYDLEDLYGNLSGETSIRKRDKLIARRDKLDSNGLHVESAEKRAQLQEEIDLLQVQIDSVDTAGFANIEDSMLLFGVNPLHQDYHNEGLSAYLFEYAGYIMRKSGVAGFDSNFDIRDHTQVAAISGHAPHTFVEKIKLFETQFTISCTVEISLVPRVNNTDDSVIGLEVHESRLGNPDTYYAIRNKRRGVSYHHKSVKRDINYKSSQDGPTALYVYCYEPSIDRTIKIKYGNIKNTLVIERSGLTLNAYGSMGEIFTEESEFSSRVVFPVHYDVFRSLKTEHRTTVAAMSPMYITSSASIQKVWKSWFSWLITIIIIVVAVVTQQYQLLAAMTFAQAVVYVTIQVVISLAVSTAVKFIAEKLGWIGKLIILVVSILMGDYESAFELTLDIVNVGIQAYTLMDTEKTTEYIKGKKDKIGELNSLRSDIAEELESFKSNLSAAFISDVFSIDSDRKNTEIVSTITRPGVFYRIALTSNNGGFNELQSAETVRTRNPINPKFIISEE